MFKKVEQLIGDREDNLTALENRKWDVAEWMIRLIEEKNTGTYNAVGPKTTQHVHSFIEEAAKAFDVNRSFVKIDDYDFLKKHHIYYIIPWIMSEGNEVGSAKINNSKAIANGLTFRPLIESMKDTHQWWYSDALTQAQRDEYELNPKSILAREQEIIAAWKSR